MTAEKNRNVMKRTEYVSCDLLTMAVAIDQSIITESVNVWSTVELGGVYTRGQLITDWQNHTKNHQNVTIVKKCDIEKAKGYYMGMVL